MAQTKGVSRLRASRRHHRAAGLAAALLCASPVGAQPERPAPARWGVDWGEQHCTLARLPENGAPAVFALWVIPGATMVHVFAGTLARDARGPAATRAVLVPGGTPVDLDAARTEGSQPPLPTGAADVAFIGELERATAIALLRGRENVGQIPLPGARGAVAALRQCIDGRLRQWGVDPAALATLRSPPRRATIGVWVNDNDYPAGARARRASGRSIARLTIDAQGRAADCAIVATSGDDDLDRAACRALRMRARFHPAIAADGRPTSAPVIQSVSWVLPTR